MHLSSPELDRSLAASARPFMALALLLTAAAAACGSSGSKSSGAGGSPGTGGAAGAAGQGSGGASGSLGTAGTGGHLATGGTGTGAGGSSSTAGSGGSSCASPQTSFGAIGQGDSNPNFQSGVGALGPNVMYIFSSYNPPGDGGMGSTDYENLRAGLRPQERCKQRAVEEPVCGSNRKPQNSAGLLRHERGRGAVGRNCAPLFQPDRYGKGPLRDVPESFHRRGDLRRGKCRWAHDSKDCFDEHQCPARLPRERLRLLSPGRVVEHEPNVHRERQIWQQFLFSGQILFRWPGRR